MSPSAQEPKCPRAQVSKRTQEPKNPRTQKPIYPRAVTLRTKKKCLFFLVGANTGIGKITAIDLAKRGATVIILCRNLERGNRAVQDIQRESGSRSVGTEQLDLSSLRSVRQCSELLNSSLEKIDILINNAGK
jgi:short-subunit dehydrogenase